MSSSPTPTIPSGFDSANIGGDILSSVSESTPINTTSLKSDALFAKYFYVSNLLIQFSDYARTGGLPTEAVFTEGSEYAITFPTPFGARPYSVIVTPAGYRDQTSDWNIYITISSISSTGFSFYIENNDGNIVWTAIGPPAPPTSTSS